MNIVFLDAKSIGEDIDLNKFKILGNVEIYNYTSESEMDQRVKNADVLIINKVQINERTMKNASNLKLVCVTATGTDNLDKDYLEKRGIHWKNVAGYSTDTVAQHTFSLVLYLQNKMNYYDQYVKSGKYIDDTIFTHFSNVIQELSGKTWGIIGLGAIGRKVADIAKAFGCHVIYYSASGKNDQKNYQRVEWDTLLAESDIISIHSPLTKDTEGLMDKNAFKKMKDSALLINVARGPIIVEEDLAEALENNQIRGAGLDVLSEEPMDPLNPLGRIKDSNKLVITPHVAWASIEARTKLMDIIFEQVREEFNIEKVIGSKAKRVVFAGDSITDSDRLWGTDERGLGNGYVSLIAEEIEKNGKYYVVNKGYNGFMVGDLKEKWDEILKEDPDYLTILIGINDVGFEIGNELTMEKIHFESDYRELIEKAKKQTNAKIILMSPFVFPQMDEYREWPEKVDEHVEVIERLALEYDLNYIDLREYYFEEVKKYGHTQLTEDGIHLSIFGHDLLKKIWLEHNYEIR